MDEDIKPNRLIHQKSPYLLQHAYNPVDWYPWCKEAFEIALSKYLPFFYLLDIHAVIGVNQVTAPNKNR